MADERDNIVYVIRKSYYDRLCHKADAKMHQNGDKELQDVVGTVMKNITVNDVNKNHSACSSSNKSASSQQIPLNEEELEAIINRGKKFVHDREHIPDIELQRAKFLSQIFYERENQLKFDLFLRDMDIRKRETLREEQHKRVGQYETEMQNEKKLSMVLRNKLKEDQLLQIFKVTEEKITKKQRQLEEEKAENLNQQQEQEDNLNMEREELAKKRTYVRRLMEENLTTKSKLKKLEVAVEKEEDKMNYVYNSLRDLTAKMKEAKIEQRFEAINKRQDAAVKSAYEVYCSNSATSNSADTTMDVNLADILEKSDNIRREETIKIAKVNADYAKYKKQKEIDNLRLIKDRESEQRKKNNALTDYVMRRINQRQDEEILKRRRCWNNDVKIKMENRKITEKEDAERLKKVKSVYGEENAGFLRDAENILDQCLQTGKPTFPIIKAIQNFKIKNSLSKTYQRKEIFSTQTPI